MRSPCRRRRWRSTTQSSCCRALRHRAISGGRHVPSHGVDFGTDDDCDDIARDGAVETHRSLVGLGGTDGLGPGLGRTGGGGAARFPACSHHQRLWHDRGRADRLLRAPRRPADPWSIGRRGTPACRAAAGCRRRRRDGRGRAADALSGLDDRVPQPAGGDGEGALTPDGFYITGDVFRQDRDGFYYFVGRGDDMFVSGGENVYPGEIEAMLERHPEIHQAVVVPVDDELKFKKPVAFVVARPGAAPSEAAVKAFALANAAPYLHPRRVWFLPVMPLAGTNKDRPAQPGAARRRAAISGLRVMPTVSFTRALERFLPAPSATVEGATVGAALAAVLATRPALRGYVLDDQGVLRRHVAVYVHGRLVDDRVGLTDPVGPRDEIYVFQALSGG